MVVDPQSVDLSIVARLHRVRELIREGCAHEQIEVLHAEIFLRRMGRINRCLYFSNRCILGTALSAEIAIAAASDLNFAIKDIIAEYEKATGNHVKLSLGSSGNFYAQIQNGAPFDLYFSADIGYPKKLEEAGLIVPGSFYRYAVGRIVLWTAS